jgi:TetR/AcrR family transcriptional repressor of mexJK operon
LTGPKTVAEEAGKAAFVPRRGRPTADQVAAIERRILTVASATFLEHGFAHSAMDAIAAAAGVSKGTLYARYAGKAELFHAVVAEQMEAWRRHGPPLRVETGISETERLYRYGIAFLARMRMPDIAAFHHLIVAEAYRFPDLARLFHDEGYRHAIDQFADELKTAAAAARWPIADPGRLVHAFVAALLGWIGIETLAGPVSDAACETYVAGLVAMFVGGRSGW